MLKYQKHNKKSEQYYQLQKGEQLLNRLKMNEGYNIWGVVWSNKCDVLYKKTLCGLNVLSDYEIVKIIKKSLFRHGF